MNILIITHYLPYPLSSGGTQAQYNMIDRLRKRHHITLVFNEGSGNTIAAMKKLQALWPDVSIIAYRYWRQLMYWRFIKDKVRRGYLIHKAPESDTLKIERALKPYGQWFSPDQRHFLRRLIKRLKPDLIQVEFYQCLRWCEFLPSGIKKVFVHHEISFIRNERFLKDIPLSERQQQWMTDAKATEIAYLNQYDSVITLTETDRDILLKNGVDKPVYVSPAAISATILPYSEWKGHVVFVGGYAHLPNREGVDWLMEKVAPFLQTPVTLHLVGAGWPSKYAVSSHGLQVVTLGFVERLADVVAQEIMVVPLLTGSGMRMKILEAAAMSVPVLTTSVGVEGLAFRHEESCLVADTPEEFAQALERLMSDGDLRKRIGCGAHRVYTQNYSVETLSKKREAVYTLLCGNDS